MSPQEISTNQPDTSDARGGPLDHRPDPTGRGDICHRRDSAITDTSAEGPPVLRSHHPEQRPGTAKPMPPERYEQSCRDGRSPPETQPHPYTIARKHTLRATVWHTATLLHSDLVPLPIFALRAGFSTVPVVKKLEIETVEGNTTRCTLPRCVFRTVQIF